MDKKLVVNNLKTYFYTYRGIVKAVDGACFDVNTGETFGLVGETGCGKSVTGLSVLRLIPEPGRIVEGEILFDDENLLEKSEGEMQKIRGNKISMIFQDPTTSLNPVLKIGDQVSEGIMIHKKLSKKNAWSQGVEMLSLTGITPSSRAKEYPYAYSGGMRQRVMIAMSLSCMPQLLIADEPTTALDVTIQAQILELIMNLKKKFSASMLLITHNLGIVAQICDRIGVMYAGEIVEIAPIKSIFKEPKHPYTVGLLKAIPRPFERKEFLHVIPGTVPSGINPPLGCKFHPRCDYSNEICCEKKPKLSEINKNRLVACHLFE